MTSSRPSSLLEGIEGVEGRSAGSRDRGSSGFDPKRVGMIVGAVAMLAVAGFLLLRAVGAFSVDPGEVSRSRIAVDSKTGKVFMDYKLKDGDAWPWKHPSTGDRSLYPAEACYWTADGQAKLEPTYVILKSIMGEEGDTICPDCGRKVVAHNPMPPTELLLKAAERSAKQDN